jgi:hypothetical protein
MVLRSNLITDDLFDIIKITLSGSVYDCVVISLNIHCVAFQFVSPVWPICVVSLEYVTYLAPSLAIYVKGYRYGAKVRKVQESLFSCVCVFVAILRWKYIHVALVKR